MHAPDAVRSPGTDVDHRDPPGAPFFALLKQTIGIRVWPDRATSRAEVFAFIETFYNRRRLRRHPEWGYLTPLEIR
ncbi:hypothetical protein UK12_34325, partial [Saccharothrix sp. ST-888]